MRHLPKTAPNANCATGKPRSGPVLWTALTRFWARSTASGTRLPTTSWTSSPLASSKDSITSSKSSNAAAMAYSILTIFFSVFFSIWRAIASLLDGPIGTLYHETPWRADYLHPSDWMQFVFGSGQDNNVFGY